MVQHVWQELDVQCERVSQASQVAVPVEPTRLDAARTAKHHDSENRKRPVHWRRPFDTTIGWFLPAVARPKNERKARDGREREKCSPKHRPHVHDGHAQRMPAPRASANDARTTIAEVKRASFAFTTELLLLFSHRLGNRAVSSPGATSRSLALRPRLTTGLPLASRRLDVCRPRRKRKVPIGHLP